MRHADCTRLSLKPERDVSVRAGRIVAESAEPWLTLDCIPTQWAGTFIEIRYRASFLDEPARPVFRFRLCEGTIVDRIGAAPIAGAGVWTGRLPIGTTHISVSPTNRRGPFDFLIEDLRVTPWWTLLARGLRTRPKSARSAVLTRLIGWKQESDVNLTWATASFALENYSHWLAVRRRPYEPNAFDSPRFDWSSTAPIRIIISDGPKHEIEQTLASLFAQEFPHWIANLPIDSDVEEPADLRITRTPSQDLIDRMRGSADQALFCVLRAGTTLVPYALAYVAEQAHRDPDHRLFYGDVVVAGDQGNGDRPLFQPGWSPRLKKTGCFPEPPFFLRGKGVPVVALEEFVASGHLPPSWASELSSSEVKPLRRILAKIIRPANATMGIATPLPRSHTTATIIIPTRDHPSLLRRIIESIRSNSRSGSYEILVADNGSTTPEARASLEELGRQPDTSYFDRPGPFDFSAICNEAAAMARSDVLVFLNDDIEVLHEGWLDRFVGLAMDPTIGAVGAKLTYPDGRLQHVGVVVGMGESAGHFGALDAGTAPGWARRNEVLHEVSAVTGACLAVARKKFEAVGGFDAEHLPVELSDIDLCLKLNARGWQTVVDPSVHLMHEESASRGGAKFRRLDVYAAQRAVFVDRWRHVLRDDPFFHPGLSLYSWEAALG